METESATPLPERSGQMPCSVFAVALLVICLPILATHAVIDGALKWWTQRVEPMEEYVRRELIVLVWIAIGLLLLRVIFY